MKKLLSLLLSAAMAASLAACSAETVSAGAEEGVSPPASLQPEASVPEGMPDEAPEETSDTSAPPAESTQPATGGTLIAYFSWSGNTEQVAQIIQREMGGDLFEIVTVTPYTDDYNELLDIARQEQGEDARPELSDQVENWESYDTIFVGYPNWWSDAPMAVYTFLESYDWTDKTLIPFQTSASGGFGRSLAGIEGSAAGAAILEGLALTEGELGDAQSAVTAWLDALALD